MRGHLCWGQVARLEFPSESSHCLEQPRDRMSLQCIRRYHGWRPDDVSQPCPLCRVLGRKIIPPEWAMIPTIHKNFLESSVIFKILKGSWDQRGCQVLLWSILMTVWYTTSCLYNRLPILCHLAYWQFQNCVKQNCTRIPSFLFFVSFGPVIFIRYIFKKLT